MKKITRGKASRLSGRQPGKQETLSKTAETWQALWDMNSLESLSAISRRFIADGRDIKRDSRQWDAEQFTNGLPLLEVVPPSLASSDANKRYLRSLETTYRFACEVDAERGNSRKSGLILILLERARFEVHGESYAPGLQRQEHSPSSAA